MATLRRVKSDLVGGGVETNLFERYGQLDRQTEGSLRPQSLLHYFEPRLYCKCPITVPFVLYLITAWSAM